MSIDDKNNNYDGNGGELHAHRVLLFYSLITRCEGFAFSLRFTYVREKGVNFNLK